MATVLQQMATFGVVIVSVVCIYLNILLILIMRNGSRSNGCMLKKQEKRKAELERDALLELNDNIPHWFITCTFDTTQYSPKDVEKLLKKVRTSHDLDGGIASIEYFSDKNPEGGHLHFHLLAPKRKKYKPCTIIDHVQKITKLQRNFIDLEQHNTNTFSNRVAYICGLKKTLKQEHIEKDREWRVEQGFTHIYLEFTESLRLKYKKEIQHALRE
jgi:hypothetical protein